MRGGSFGLGEGGDGAQQVASAPVHEQVGQAGGVCVEYLPGAVADEVVGAARGQAAAVALGDDEGGGGFVGERAAVQCRVGQGLFTGGDDHVVQAGVGGDGAGAFQLVLAALRAEVVERDREQALARPGAVAEDGAGQPGESGGQQGEGRGGAASGEVGADAGYGRPSGGAAFGGPHAGDGSGVGRQGLRGVARGGQPGAYGFDERVPYALDGSDRVDLGRRHGEGRHRFVARDLPGALPEDERVARRDPLHPGVRGAVAQGFRCLRAGEQCGQVADVQLGLDEVRQRKGGGGVRGSVGPGRVEDGAGSGDVTCDGDAAADLDDGRVAAGPGGEMAQRPAAGGEQSDAELFVGGTAAA